MSRLKWGFLALLMLPVAEGAVFVVLGLLIGWIPTFAACLATSTIGLLLLRRFGRTDLDRFLATLARDGLRAIHLENPGLAQLIGAILLLLPGFITDAAGALLFLPQARRWARIKLAAHRPARRDRHGRTLIDLPPDQWRQLPDDPPGRKRGRKGGS